jgi:two-component system, NtrC family, nitrogen regulation response regulator GlnG
MEKLPLKILVAQEDPATRWLYQRLLQEDGYQVFMVESGFQALNLIVEQDFDLLVLDLNLNDIDLLEILPLIRKKRPSLPVVVASSYHLHAEEIKKGYLDVHQLVPQPLTCYKLRETVRQILGKSSVNPPSLGNDPLFDPRLFSIN